MRDQKLLEEIFQNASTGIYAIDVLLPKVEDTRVSQHLETQRQKMESISQTAQEMMRLRSQEIPAMPVMNRAGIWTGTQMNTFIDNSPSHVAEMVIQGDTTGITQMISALNEYSDADVDIVGLGTELVNIQRRGIENLKKYL